MFFEDLARLSEKAGQARQAEIYRECSEMAKQVNHPPWEFCPNFTVFCLPFVGLFNWAA